MDKCTCTIDTNDLASAIADGIRQAIAGPCCQTDRDASGTCCEPADKDAKTVVVVCRCGQ